MWAVVGNDAGLATRVRDAPDVADTTLPAGGRIALIARGRWSLAFRLAYLMLAAFSLPDWASRWASVPLRALDPT